MKIIKIFLSVLLTMAIAMPNLSAQHVPITPHGKKIKLTAPRFKTVGDKTVFSCGDGYTIEYRGGKRVCVKLTDGICDQYFAAPSHSFSVGDAVFIKAGQVTTAKNTVSGDSLANWIVVETETDTVRLAKCGVWDYNHASTDGLMLFQGVNFPTLDPSSLTWNKPLYTTIGTNKIEVLVGQRAIEDTQPTDGHSPSSITMGSDSMNICEVELGSKTVVDMRGAGNERSNYFFDASIIGTEYAGLQGVARAISGLGTNTSNTTNPILLPVDEKKYLRAKVKFHSSGVLSPQELDTMDVLTQGISDNIHHLYTDSNFVYLVLDAPIAFNQTSANASDDSRIFVEYADVITPAKVNMNAAVLKLNNTPELAQAPTHYLAKDADGVVSEFPIQDINQKLTNTQVAYGSTDDEITSNNQLEYDPDRGQLQIGGERFGSFAGLQVITKDTNALGAMSLIYNRMHNTIGDIHDGTNTAGITNHLVNDNDGFGMTTQVIAHSNNADRLPVQNTVGLVFSSSNVTNTPYEEGLPPTGAAASAFIGCNDKDAIQDLDIITNYFSESQDESIIASFRMKGASRGQFSLDMYSSDNSIFLDNNPASITSFNADGEMRRTEAKTIAKKIVGEITMYAGSTAPDGFAICDGSILNIVDFPELFAVIGTSYGGDGTTNFALPDMRQRVPLGANTNYPLASSGGQDSISLLVENLPPHNHAATLRASTTGATFDNPQGRLLGLTTNDNSIYADSALPVPHRTFSSESIEVSDTGDGTLVNNMQPYIAINYIIAVE